MGCQYLKEKFRYLHNDIKPEHVFICEGHAKLGGFSAASKLPAHQRTVAVSPTSQRSFLYKAPEVDKNQEYS
jgi:serine/threonine protein kinase